MPEWYTDYAINSKVHIAQLIQLAKRMCSTWNISMPNIIIDEELQILKKNEGGEFIKENNTVIIRRSSNNICTLAYFFHEMRHVWQQRDYGILLDLYGFNKILYNQFHDSLSIELDADCFALHCALNTDHWRTFPSLEDLLHNEKTFLLSLSHQKTLSIPELFRLTLGKWNK